MEESEGIPIASTSALPPPALPSIILEPPSFQSPSALQTNSFESEQLPTLPTISIPTPAPAPALYVRPARKRRSTIKPDDSPPPERVSNRGRSKLKLKVNSNGNNNSNGNGGGGGGNSKKDSNKEDLNLLLGNQSNQVGYDRELDSDPDEPLAFEEHFILRLPPGELATKLHEQVSKRELNDSTWFKFKDSRRAVFKFNNQLFGAKLVDLPTLIESQKLTGVGGHSVKVADISQMLIVEDEIQDENEVTRESNFNIEDFIYPHGITPPLKHVRKRRFRKRVNKRTIEIVEDAVEKLLEADATCEESKYELLDHEGNSEDDYNSDNDDRNLKINLNNNKRNRNRDQSIGSTGEPTPLGDEMDAEGEEEDGFYDGDEGDGTGGERGEGEGEEGEDGEEGSGYDSDLADEINRGMQAQNGSDDSDEDGSEEEDEDGNPIPGTSKNKKNKNKAKEGSDDSDIDDLFGGSSDPDDEEEEEEEEEEEGDRDDPETLEEKRRIKLLAEEMGDLERAISVKEVDMLKATNPIFKKRFEEVIKKLTTDRDSKKSQHLAAIRELERKKELAKKVIEDQKQVEEAAKLAAAPAQTPLVAASVPVAVVTNPTPVKESDGMEVDE